MQCDCFKEKGHKKTSELANPFFAKMTSWLWSQYINLTKIAWELKLF